MDVLPSTTLQTTAGPPHRSDLPSVSNASSGPGVTHTQTGGQTVAGTLPTNGPTDTPGGSLLVRILTYFGFGRQATRSRRSFMSMLWNLFWGLCQIVVITVFLVLIKHDFKSPSNPSISEWSACDRPLGIWACLWIIRVALSVLLAYWEYRRDRILHPPSHPEDATTTSPIQQPQPGASGNNTSPASPAVQQGDASATPDRPDPESLPHSHLYSRLTLLSSLITLSWFLTANILLYTSLKTCRLAAPHLWWLLFGILSIMYLMVLEIVVLGFVVLVVAPILFIFWNVFLFAIGRHPMQNPGMIKHEIGKLSKATVDRIPLVIYIPAPPDSSDPKAEIHQMPHVYPPKLQKRRLQFKLLQGMKVFKGTAKTESSSDDSEDKSKRQSDSWADKWEETEYPFVTLEGNRAACAVCLMDYEEPKRKSDAETDDPKPRADLEEGTSKLMDAPAKPIVQEAKGLKLSDAGQGSQPLRLLGCGHVFHKTCLDPWLTDVSGRCPVCQRAVDPVKPHKSKRMA